MRLLAAVVAKNAVGSSWRKTVALREYSRLPEAEKAAVRALALELLFAEPSPRVATQLSLLVTNIARYGWNTPDTACKAVGTELCPMEGLAFKVLSLVSPSTALASCLWCFHAQCKHFDLQMHKQSYPSAGNSLRSLPGQRILPRSGARSHRTWCSILQHAFLLHESPVTPRSSPEAKPLHAPCHYMLPRLFRFVQLSLMATSIAWHGPQPQTCGSF